MSHAAKGNAGHSGFTLIEAVIALAIVATSLASIGALIATTNRATNSIDGHLLRLQALRAVAAALPGRDQLANGQTSGELGGRRWQLDVSPYLRSRAAGRDQPAWVPYVVALTVQSAGSPPIRIDSVRLKRRTDR
ncbi:MAG: prepilin-type cleavage/methylation domain-containing protein [Proteobacteria bacterium]|nr:MAG: prepilin-type cleavage/methylation domain-containing protein [Pseudomonadota bacterium]